MTNLDNILKSRYHLADKGPYMVFPVVLYGCENWTIKKAEHWNWRFWTVVLEKTWESLEPQVDQILKEINPWILIGKTDAEAEAPILWAPNTKSRLIGKDPDVGKDWGQYEKGPAQDEMVGWHSWLNGHEFEQTPGKSKEQGSLVCCSPWGHKELDTAEWQNSNNKAVQPSITLQN